MPPSSQTRTSAAQLREAITAINELIGTAAQAILELSASFAEVYAEFFSGGQLAPQRLESLAARLEPQCLTVLDQQAPRLIEGIGLVWVAPDGSSGMLWWRAEQGTIGRKHHVFNPDSDSFYDYRNSVWFLGAQRGAGLSIVGPYIDSWGTDDHTLTASITMEAKHGPAAAASSGVAAADLNLQKLTGQIEAMLEPLSPAVLVSSEDRVIASNIALLTPGLRLTPFLKKSGLHIASRHDTSLTSWQLVFLPNSIPSQ